MGGDSPSTPMAATGGDSPSTPARRGQEEDTPASREKDPRGTTAVVVTPPPKEATPSPASDEGSPVQTHTHKVRSSKDGLYYASLELVRRANIRVNEQRLKDLGLLDRRLAKKKVTRTPTKRKTTPAAPQRRSGRHRHTPEFFVNDLPDEHVTPRPKAKKARTVTPPSLTPSSYSRSDRVALAARYPDALSWLDDMKYFLDVQQELSAANSRSVMRQVEKLCTGAGIYYHHWTAKVCFGKGQRVDLSWDFEALFVQAYDFEDEHGRDLGNGWLLRHPIKKLQNFQEHLLNGGDKA